MQIKILKAIPGGGGDDITTYPCAHYSYRVVTEVMVDNDSRRAPEDRLGFDHPHIRIEVVPHDLKKDGIKVLELPRDGHTIFVENDAQPSRTINTLRWPLRRLD